MTINEIKDKIKSLKEARMAVIDAAEKDQRDLTAAEIKDNEEAMGEIRSLEKELTIMELRKVSATAVKPQATTEVRQFSLQQAIRETAFPGEYRQSEETRAINELGAKELRAAGIVAEKGMTVMLPTIESRATITATAGAAAIATELQPLMGPLRDALVLTQAGAHFMTGLRGTLSFPAYSGSTANWVAPGTSVAQGEGTFSAVTMSPKRLAAMIIVDKQFLLQDSVDAEAMLRRDIIDAIVGKLEATVFGKHSKSTANTPDGLLSGVTLTAAVPTKANTTALKAAVRKANIPTMRPAYVTNSEGYALLETTRLDSGSGLFLLENGRLNGVPVLETNGVVSGGSGGTEHPLIYGDFSQLIIGQWGAIELKVDPYTLADKDQVRIIVNSYWDIKARRDAAFKSTAIKAGA